jgi:hypothetical protein
MSGKPAARNGAASPANSSGTHLMEVDLQPIPRQRKNLVESVRKTPRRAPDCRTGVTFGHATLLLLTICSVSLCGQQAANPSTTVNLPFFGPAIFDAAGNSYSTGGGTVTAGAAQTQPGGGSCLLVGP